MTPKERIREILSNPPAEPVYLAEGLRQIADCLAQEVLYKAAALPESVTDDLIEKLLNENTVSFGEDGGHFNHVQFLIGIRTAIEAPLVAACGPFVPKAPGNTP